MAFRRPLYYDGSNLREMNDSQIGQLRAQAAALYMASPSVTITATSSGGNLGTINDTRLTSGKSRVSASRFFNENETEEPRTATNSYSKINQSVQTTGAINSSLGFFLYYNSSGNLQTMDWQDMIDTFGPATSLLKNDTLFRIHTSTSLSGYTATDNGRFVFLDTRANVSEFRADRIGTNGTIQSHLSNIQFYYLLQRTSSFPYSAYTNPVTLNSSGDVIQSSGSNTEYWLRTLMQNVASSVDGYKIRYNINGSGTACGSTMVNTILNGSGNYQTRFVNANDYRAQEFPNGSSTVANSYTLKVNIV